jgi:hypothetical protein
MSLKEIIDSHECEGGTHIYIYHECLLRMLRKNGIICFETTQTTFYKQELITDAHIQCISEVTLRPLKNVTPTLIRGHVFS